MPQVALGSNMLFALKTWSYSPQVPRMKQPFTIKGHIDLFGITFYGPLWVIASVTYPEQWWEVVGSPVMHEMSMAIGGDFEIKFGTGFDREGEYSLIVRVYAGPTISTEAGLIKTMTLPPFPAVATDEATFTVAGEIPPEDQLCIAQQPVVTPADIYEGTEVSISIPVKCQALAALTATITCTVTYGSLLPGPGKMINTYTSAPTKMNPGQTLSFPFEHIEVAPNDGRRDIVFEATVGGATVGYNHFDDAYSVKETVIDFAYSQPTINGTVKAHVNPTDPLTIMCPIKSNCNIAMTVKAKVGIYQGSIWSTPGDTVVEKTGTAFTINPGDSVNIKVTTTADSAICPKDIRVFLLKDTTEISRSQIFADAYYVEKPTLTFTFSQPTINGTTFTKVYARDPLTIICPVISKSSISLTLKARIEIYQGSAWFSPGDLVEQLPVPQFTIAPNATANLKVTTTTDNAVCPKDIRVFLLRLDDSEIAKSQLFANAYSVEKEVIAFTLGQPSASPYIAQPGQAVSINCPVTSQSNKTQMVSILIEVKLTGFAWMAGTTIDSKRITSISIAPNETYNAAMSHTATTSGPTDAAGRAGRHIAVTVFTDSTVAPNTGPNNPNEFDNIFYVQVSAPPGQYTLTVSKVPDLPEYSVTRSPDKTSYNQGETVSLVASPADQFDHWEGDVTGTNPYAYVTMNANKSVVAVFKPAVPSAVSFWVYAAEPPYLATADWMLFYFPEGSDQWIGDQKWHGIEDPILFGSVPPRGYFAAFCSSIFGDVSPQYTGPLFNFAEGATYEYAIVPGTVRRL